MQYGNNPILDPTGEQGRLQCGYPLSRNTQQLYCRLHKSVPPSILKITTRCPYHQISNEVSLYLPHDIDVNIVNISTQMIL